MALAIDGSSPTTVTAAVGPGVTTASFTPPAGSLLLPLWAGDSANTNPGTPSITDNLGAHLTYTAGPWKSSADAPGEFGQTALWTAPVAASAAQTVTVTNGAASHADSALCVLVLTGQNASPVGASGKSGSVSAAAIAQSFTGTASGSQGFIAVLDWDALGSMTAGTGCTLIATGTIPGNVSYGFFRRTTADGTNGGTTTMNVNLPGTSTNLSWSYVEIKPAAGASTVAAPPTQVIPMTGQRTRINPIIVAPTIGPPQVIQVPQIAVVQNPRVRPGPPPVALTPLPLPQSAAPILVAPQQFRPAQVAPVSVNPPFLSPQAQPAFVLVTSQQFRPQAAPPVTLAPTLLPSGLPVPSAPYWINPSRSQPPLAAVTCVTPPLLPQTPAPITVAPARPQPPLAAVITIVPGPLPQAVAPVVVVTSTWRPRQPQTSLSQPTFPAAGLALAPIVVVPTFTVRATARPLVLVGTAASTAGPDIDITVADPRTGWSADLAGTWTTRSVRTAWTTDNPEQTWTTGGLQ